MIHKSLAKKITETTSSIFSGCVGMIRITKCLVERSTFTQCQSKGSSGGALIIYNPKNASVVRNCSFTRNKAIKTGGAIYITYMEYFVKKGAGTTLIENCIFQNNEAVDVGQSVHSTGRCYLNLQNVTILTKGNNGVTHLQLEGNLVTIGNVKLIQGATEYIQSGLVMRGITVTSGDLKINGNVSYICPKHFHTVSYHTSYYYYRSYYTSFEAFDIISFVNNS